MTVQFVVDWFAIAVVIIALIAIGICAVDWLKKVVGR